MPDNNDADKFLSLYEKAASSRDFAKVRPLLSEDAIFWFSDGSFQGMDQIRHAFERT